jgi:hypothetical protein
VDDAGADKSSFGGPSYLGFIGQQPDSDAGARLDFIVQSPQLWGRPLTISARLASEYDDRAPCRNQPHWKVGLLADPIALRVWQNPKPD